MFALLNRFALFISIAIASIPLIIDWDLFIFSLIIFFVMRLGIFSSERIQRAVDEGNMAMKNITPEIDTQTLSLGEKKTIYNIDEERLSSRVVEPSIDSHGKFTSQSLNEDTPIVMTEKESEVIIPLDEPSGFSLWINAFFADRPLAKVGGILLFLGALFFLWLIFDAVGPVGKILIGLAFGFFLIGVGVWLDKKEIEIESRVLMGIGIAINYMTILSGRYLLGNGLIGDEPLFSDIFATFALLLNTVFAVSIALVYRSRVLLSFAFVFAYLTPILIDSESSSILLLSVYITLITVAASVIVYLYTRTMKQDSLLLHSISTLGMLALFVLGTFSLETAGEYISLFLGVFVSGGALILSAYRDKTIMTSVFIALYIIVAASLFGGTITLLPLVLILLFVGVFIAFFFELLSVVLIASLGVVSFFIGICAFWIVGPAFFPSILILGFVIFLFLSIVLIRSGSVAVGFIGVLGYGLLILFSTITLVSTDALTLQSVGLSKISAIVLLSGASILSLFTRDARIYLFTIVMSGILIIFPNTYSEYFTISWIVALFYIALSFIIPYSLLVRGSLQSQSSLLAAFPLAQICIAYSLYQVGSLEFPGLILGLGYIVHAISTLVYALILRNHFLKIEKQTTSMTKNTILILFAIPLSLFTFALAFVFRDTPSVMSLAWVLESTILYFVATRMEDKRILSAAHIVLGLGLIKEISLINSFFTGDWLSFGLILIMGGALFMSLFVLKDENSAERKIYDILHIIGILILGAGISQIVPSTSTGWSILSSSIFLLVITFFYRFYGLQVQHVFLTVFIGMVSLYFIGDFVYLDKGEFIPLIVQGLALIILFLSGTMYSRGLGTVRVMRLFIVVLAALIITSLYVDNFMGTFAVSIYLALISSILIILGIQKDKTVYRTIGLYVGIFVLVKILAYDIWYTSGDLIFRVVALMVTGGMMIYLSQLYAKHVSRTWSEELSFENIVPKHTPPDTSVTHDEVSIEAEGDENPFDEALIEKLKHIDTKDITGIRFIHNSGSDFVIRRVGMIKVALFILENMKKKIFTSGELTSVFATLVPHLKSTLSKSELTNLLSKVEDWISEGGSIEVLYKNKL